MINALGSLGQLVVGHAAIAERHHQQLPALETNSPGFVIVRLAQRRADRFDVIGRQAPWSNNLDRHVADKSLGGRFHVVGSLHA